MPTTFQPGSRTSPPVGLEGTFVYNGLTLNDRSSPDRYQITSISGLDDADVRDSRELLSAQHGETAFLAYYGGRTLSFKGEIRAGNISKIRDMQEDLRSAFALLTEVPFYCYSPGGLADCMFEKVRKGAPLQGAESQDSMKIKRDFLITLRSSDPWMVGTSLTTTHLTSGGSTSVNNLGNFYSYPVIVFTGPLTTPSLAVGGYVVSLTTIASGAGNVITVDVRNKTIIDGGGLFQYSKVTTPTDWPWPLLVPGSNTITLTASGAGSIDVKWRNTWV
jgi:hypothetical protein